MGGLGTRVVLVLVLVLVLVSEFMSPLAINYQFVGFPQNQARVAQAETVASQQRVPARRNTVNTGQRCSICVNEL